MHQLILLRHAKAAASAADGSDHARPLTDAGSVAAAGIGRAMRQAGLAPDVVLVSPSQRTQQTFAALETAGVWAEWPNVESLPALYMATPHNAAVYAPKGALGHSVGAVGAVESILTVMALRDQVIPPTLNLVNLDPEIDLDVVAGKPRTGDYKYAINNSFGFGGHNVAITFGR